MTQDPKPAAAGDPVAAGWVSALARDAQLAFSISDAVLALPGVAALSAGEYGRFGTFGGERRVPGVGVDDAQVGVHIIAQFGIPLGTTASDITSAVQPWLNGRTLQITVDDILMPGEELVPEQMEKMTNPTRIPPSAPEHG